MPQEQQSAAPVILLVDDDPAVLGSLKFSLELDGYAVAAHASAESVLAQGVLPAGGCMVVDYGLPGINGLDLIAVLRGRGLHLPAILMTSHPGPLLRERARAAGVAIVEKPLLGQALNDAIRTATGS